MNYDPLDWQQRTPLQTCSLTWEMGSDFLNHFGKVKKEKSGRMKGWTEGYASLMRPFWALKKKRKKKKRSQRARKERKEQHPEVLEGATTNQVSISHVSLPVGLSGRTVAWHGGQRGTGPVRLTQEVMHRANRQMRTHTHTHATLLFPNKCNSS